ncbi:MAG: hypothetical protein R3C68_18110 [Myxococcota bacterium]
MTERWWTIEGLWRASVFLGRHRIALVAHRPHSGLSGAGALRKVMRLLNLAQRFNLALVTFIDVNGQHMAGVPHGALWQAVGQTLEGNDPHVGPDGWSTLW